MDSLWAGMALPGDVAGPSLPQVDDCPQTASSAPGRGGWLVSEWVAGLDWIQWLVCVGITGWIPSEPAPARGGILLVHGEPGAIKGLAKRVVGRGIAPATAVILPMLDEAFRLGPGAVPVRDAVASTSRRGAPETVGEPDWHNRRAALLLGIEAALDKAPDDQARAALIDRLLVVIDSAAAP